MISCTAPPALRIGIELAHERMGGANLVVAVGADQEQMPDILLDQKILHEIERRGIEPLQIVEEKRQRMFVARENTDEAAEHQLEAAFRLLRLKFRDRRLFSDNEL